MCIVTMRSMTQAIRAKNALNSKGIYVEIQNLDQSVTARGCAYGLSFHCQERESIKRLLDSKGLTYGEWIGGARANAAINNDIS